MSLFSYFKYYLNAKTKYQIHSPFVFEFVQEVLEDQRNYYYFNTIKHFINRIKNDTTPITDPISGLKTKVSAVARAQYLSPSVGQLLFKSINYYRPSTLLEFGTGLGLNTLYQCTPSTSLPFHTFEANKALAQVAKENFQILGIRHVQLHSGPIEEKANALLSSSAAPDYIFINCDLPSSFLYQLIKLSHSNSMFVINKPHTKGKKHWDWFCQQETISLTMDLYDIGIAFKRIEQKEKTHFSLIKNRKKPWAIFW